MQHSITETNHPTEGRRRVSMLSSTILLAFIVMMISAVAASAQTTAFTYQGKLAESGSPASGLYDFRMTLWDQSSGGIQIGPTVGLPDTPVADGIFTVTLDFGANAFDGGMRFLEISVKPAGNPLVLPTLLTPRQQVMSTPYAVKSLSATSADGLSVACVSCVTSDQIQSVSADQVTTGTLNTARGGTGLSSTGTAGNYLRSNGSSWTSSSLLAADVNGTLPVAKGGTGLNSTGAAGNYIRSDGSNFVSSPLQVSDVPDLSGAYIKNSLTTQIGASFSITGNGAASGTLSGGTVNASTQYNLNGNRVLSNPGSNNLFAGVNAGAANSGFNNSFFGRDAGTINTTGNNNSFFGNGAGRNNNQGFNNSFFGKEAGFSNTNSNSNSFFGSAAGFGNTVGNDNSFFGKSAGASNTIGSNNSFFGRDAGLNTLASNNSFFGRGAGTNNDTGANNSFFGQNTGTTSVVGSNNTLIGSNADVINAFIEYGTAIGANSKVLNNNTVALGRPDGSDRVVVYGRLFVGDLTAGGGAPLCYWEGVIMACNLSSLRFKTNVQSFMPGLNVVNRLRPIAFNWKGDGRADVGFAAEEVAKIEPLLTLYNAKGEIEGVKYNQISVVLVNAIKEQQAQIASQQAQITRLQVTQAENHELRTQLVAFSKRLEKLEKRRGRLK